MVEKLSMSEKCRFCNGDGVVQPLVAVRAVGSPVRKPDPKQCGACAGTGLRDGKSLLANRMQIPQGYGRRVG